MQAISLYWFALQQQNSIFKWQKFVLFYVKFEASPVDNGRSFLYCNELTINTGIIENSHPSGNSNKFAPLN